MSDRTFGNHASWIFYLPGADGLGLAFVTISNSDPRRRLPASGQRLLCAARTCLPMTTYPPRIPRWLPPPPGACWPSCGASTADPLRCLPLLRALRCPFYLPYKHHRVETLSHAMPATPFFGLPNTPLPPAYRAHAAGPHAHTTRRRRTNSISGRHAAITRIFMDDVFSSRIDIFLPARKTGAASGRPVTHELGQTATWWYLHSPSMNAISRILRSLRFAPSSWLLRLPMLPRTSSRAYRHSTSSLSPLLLPTTTIPSPALRPTASYLL